ncbi:MAG: CoA-acylating methylmalonate-semialdehyde dehydrogenase [Bacteroidetes bacterium]|jgi:malonate-semialdehyde dehydrogenase (acetylating)/methylmalonate-semialdehyde dehydrogenase|nr:CoA-acylating methylmalonate-semialdehyde dehydrogenase [Bacteroidota bacterium]
MENSNHDIVNYINGSWKQPESGNDLPVTNPASMEQIATVHMSGRSDVKEAVEIADEAFYAWRRTPVTNRIQYLFQFKNLLEEHIDDLATIITNECGKTFKESVGEIRRGIENVENACGMPTLMQGYNNEDIATGIDEHMIRQPLGVVTAITPFNFPAMIPLWFLPYAIACGNCFILKPSEKVPMSAKYIFELLDKLNLPEGVVQLVNGDKEAVDELLENPAVKAISFVGSSAVARHIYSKGTAHGKRVQAQGGAKNMVVVLPDAEINMTTRIVGDSAFGCAGQRCLANSLAVTVGEARVPFTEAITEKAANLKVGYGLEEETEMGPVISPDSRERIEGFVETGKNEGGRVLVDGRGKTVEKFKNGNWSYPTIIDNISPDSSLAKTEVFGPLFGLMHVDTIDDAIALINTQSYGNMACLFTSSGAAARQFRYEATAGNIGINIGVAAPMAYYPFSGWKESFFGDLHAQGSHAVEFYTQTKVVVERWIRDWDRVF